MADDKQTPVLEEDGLSVKDAAKEIEGLLSDDDVDEIVNGSVTDDDEDSQPSAAKKKSPPKREEPVEKEDDEDDLDDEDEDDDVDEDEDVDEEDDEDEEAEQAPAQRGKLHRVKVDGEDLEVPYDELVAGYSRTASFTKKSQALAEEKRQHDAQITATRERYIERLQALEEALADDEPDWDEVRRTNPEQFAELHAAWQVHKDRLATIQAERQEEERKLAQTRLAQHSEIVKSERAKLVQAIPEWGDKTEKGAAFRRSIRDFGLAQGFSAEELEGTVDHRAFKILHQAMLYEQSLKKKKEVQEKGKKKVEAIGQIKPGAKPASRKSRKAIQRQQNAARLKKTGNVRDAASLIESMLD